MIRRIVELSLDRRFLVLLLAGLLALIGLSSSLRLPSDVLPELNAPVILAFVENPDRTAEEMEISVARPLEGAVTGLQGVERVQSLSGPGLATVIVWFDWDREFREALRQVGNAVHQIRGEFPEGTRSPVLSSAASRMNQVLEFSVDGPFSLRELRELVEYEVAPQLTAEAGVQRLIVMGGERRQLDVHLDSRRLARHGLTAADAAEFLERSSSSLAGGLLRHGPHELSVRGTSRFESVEELRRLPVPADAGTVPLSELGAVEVGNRLRRGISRVGGEEVVTAAVVKQFDANAREVIEQVKRSLDRLRPQLPEGVRVEPYYDQSELIEVSNRSLQEALVIGAAAVVAVIFLLMGDWIATLVITAVIPLAILPAFTFMELAGVGVNIMSLGGLVVALGIMIDAAIVDTENIYRHMQEEPGDARAATVAGALEVRRPILFATAVIIAVFLPVAFLPGLARRLFAPFAYTAIVTLAYGYLLSLTVTPVLAFTFLSDRPERERGTSRLMAAIEKVHRPTLRAALRHPLAALALTAAIGAAAAVGAAALPVGFLPSFDEGAVMLKAQTPPGTGLQETDRVAQRVAEVASRAPDVVRVVNRAGRPVGVEEIEGVNNSELFVELAPFDERTASLEEIEGWLRERLGDIPGTRLVVTSPLLERIEESLGGESAPLLVKVFGPDPEQLDELGRRVADAMADVPGLVDVVPEQTVGVPQLRVDVDRERAARLGLSAADVSEAAELAWGGQVVGTVLRGGRRTYPVRVRLAPDERREIGDLRRLRLPTPGGETVRLDRVASVEVARGLALVRRENGQRRTQVRAGLEGIGLDEAVDRLDRRLDELSLPEGVRVEYGGTYRQQQSLERTMLLASGVAVLLIFVLLQAGFDSAVLALLVLATIPLALIGGVAALLLTGLALNVSSMIGLLAHFGLAVQKSVLFVEQSRLERLEGRSGLAAAWRSARVRLRPVLLTATTASLAVLPIALGFGAGSELQQPMAVVLIGGLVTSTVLTVVVLPVLLHLHFRRSG